MIPEALQHIDFDELADDHKKALKEKLLERKKQLQEAITHIDKALEQCG